MTELTALDTAHDRMQRAPDDDDARLSYFETFAASEMFLMLAVDAGDADENVTPELFDLDDGRYVLVFDREERLASFSGQETPYVALSGRSVIGMLQGQNIGLGVNLGATPSSNLLPATAIDWLHEMLSNTPEAFEGQIAEVTAPAGLPESLIKALDTKLATAMGLAVSAYLAGVRYRNGTRGHVLGFIGAVPQARDALAQAAAEALTFSGIEAGAMDIGFFRASDTIVQRLERVGLRFDLPQLQKTVTKPHIAPGSDPENPPRLK